MRRKALDVLYVLVDVLKVVETDEGELLLVDGHLRRDLIGSGTVQVAVLDLDERETKQVLAHFDQVGNMADVDAALLPEDWRPGECKGMFAWVLANPREVVEVPMPGKLNLWHIDEALVEHV